MLAAIRLSPAPRPIGRRPAGAAPRRAALLPRPPAATDADGDSNASPSAPAEEDLVVAEARLEAMERGARRGTGAAL